MTKHQNSFKLTFTLILSVFVIISSGYERYNRVKRYEQYFLKNSEKKGLNPNLWNSIEKVIVYITGERSKETLGYIKKIATVMEVLE